jgi:hypothetical protein
MKSKMCRNKRLFLPLFGFLQTKTLENGQTQERSICSPLCLPFHPSAGQLISVDSHPAKKSFPIKFVQHERKFVVFIAGEVGGRLQITSAVKDVL